MSYCGHGVVMHCLGAGAQPYPVGTATDAQGSARDGAEPSAACAGPARAGDRAVNATAAAVRIRFLITNVRHSRRVARAAVPGSPSHPPGPTNSPQKGTPCRQLLSLLVALLRLSCRCATGQVQTAQNRAGERDEFTLAYHSTTVRAIAPAAEREDSPEGSHAPSACPCPGRDRVVHPCRSRLRRYPGLSWTARGDGLRARWFRTGCRQPFRRDLLRPCLGNRRP